MQSRHIAVPAYAVAFLLVFFPLLDTALSVFPPRLDEIGWRFGAAGLFSRALMTPLLGLLLAFAVALLLEHRKAQRAISVFSGFVAFVVLGGMVMFVLDTLQMRVQVQPRAKLAFDVATVVALGKYGLGLIVLAAFTVSGSKASRAENRVMKGRNQEIVSTVGLLVGRR